jgi:hypothetical protein
MRTATRQPTDTAAEEQDRYTNYSRNDDSLLRNRPRISTTAATTHALDWSWYRSGCCSGGTLCCRRQHSENPIGSQRYRPRRASNIGGNSRGGCQSHCSGRCEDRFRTDGGRRYDDLANVRCGDRASGNVDNCSNCLIPHIAHLVCRERAQVAVVDDLYSERSFQRLSRRRRRRGRVSWGQCCGCVGWQARRGCGWCHRGCRRGGRRWCPSR